VIAVVIAVLIAVVIVFIAPDAIAIAPDTVFIAPDAVAIAHHAAYALAAQIAQFSKLFILEETFELTAVRAG